MIEFANLCLEQAKTVKHEFIANDDIADARPAYFQYLIEELNDEIHVEIPQWKRLLDVLRRVHRMRFTRGEFETAFEELGLNAKGFEMDSSLETLYRYGIIGFEKIGGGRGGSATAFSFREETVNFDPAARHFRIHPGLKEALELVESAA